MAQQGYSKLNNGYGEEPGINWGKIGLYSAGAAAGYGVIRAGAMKAKQLGTPAFKSGKAIGGGILGMNMQGGWKGYQQLGEGVLGNGALSKTQRAGNRRGMTGATKAARTMGKAKAGRKAANAAKSSTFAGNLQQAKSSLDNANWAVQEAQRKRALAEASHVPTPASGSMAMDIWHGNMHGTKSRLAAAQNTQKEAQQMFGMRQSVAKTHTERLSRPITGDTVAGLKPSQVLGRRSSRALDPGSARGFAQGAAGFFGAMDYAGAGNMKRFGVGAARVGLAAGAIGLGMKALSALNPFSD